MNCPNAVVVALPFIELPKDTKVLKLVEIARKPTHHVVLCELGTPLEFYERLYRKLRKQLGYGNSLLYTVAVNVSNLWEFIYLITNRTRFCNFCKRHKWHDPTFFFMKCKNDWGLYTNYILRAVGEQPNDNVQFYKLTNTLGVQIPPPNIQRMLERHDKYIYTITNGRI